MEVKTNIEFTDKDVKLTTFEPVFDDIGFIENNLIILTKFTIDKFLQENNPGELIALYTFYYYTAKWQKTNLIKCTTDYVSKGLKWSKEKVIKIKKNLMELGLIQDFKRIDKKTCKISGWYIKMNYIFKQSTVDNTIHPCIIPDSGKPQTVENPDTNALSVFNLNALNTNNSEKSLYKFKDYQKIYDDYIKSHSTKKQEEINMIIWNDGKERNAFKNLIKNMVSPDFLLKYILTWKEHKWVQDNAIQCHPSKLLCIKSDVMATIYEKMNVQPGLTQTQLDAARELANKRRLQELDEQIERESNGI
jgi:hypothetical protein